MAPSFLYALQDNPADPMQGPMDVAVDELGRVFVSDTDNGRMLRFDKNGILEASFGEQELEQPYGVDVFRGRVYVADLAKGRIQVFSDMGGFLYTLVESGAEVFGSFMPTVLTVNKNNGDVYFADVFEHRIVIVENDGKKKHEFGRPGSEVGELAYPNGIALDGSGRVYVSDSNNARVQVFSPDGQDVLEVYDGTLYDDGAFSLPRGISVDQSGSVWVADTLTHSISVFKGNKRVLLFGELGVNEGELYFPNGLTVDKQGHIYIVERGLNRVSVFGYRLRN
jgi:DNA-binding beta-propeller fold protein YncE